MHPTEQLNAALAGRYTIERLVGEGGMATVYRARDLRHQRNVALKVLKPDLGAVVGVERFLSEIQVTANLQHPNLLPLFDSGAADNLLFYVMPYVEGESLRHRIDREKQLPVDEAVRIATAVASALDYAHRHGVIHRDLKPENILLHEGQPLVADFGIALAVSNAGGNRITQTGLSLGTPQYMSPEQATGDRVIDGRTDIYSLGAVTYEMLTGEAPHVGSTSQAIIARLLTEKPRAVRASRPNVPEHIEAALECALEKLPADRWSTAREFSEALTGGRTAARRTTTTTSPAPAAPLTRRPQPRELVAWGLALAGVAAAVVLAVRASGPDAPLVTTDFEMMLPESLSPTVIGSQASITLSRDGSTLVFHGTRPGAASALWIRQLGDRTVQRIRGTDSARTPVLSPDGNEVLFNTGVPGINSALKRVSIRGGTARTVIETASPQYSWGDGGQIVYALDDELWIVSDNGGQPRRLASPDSTRGQLRFGWPEVLPGGTAAMITIWRGVNLVDSAYIGVLSIPDGQVTDLGVRGMYARYSETGHVLFVTTDGVLNAAPFSQASKRITGSAETVAENVRFGTGGAAGVAVSRTGTLAYVAGPPTAIGLQDLLAVSKSGVERELGARPGYFRAPRVSPDGRQIALTILTGTSAGRGRVALQNPDVWRFDVAAKLLARVTTDSSSAYPAWSPGGEEISYVANDSTVMRRPLYATGQPTPLVTLDRPIAEVSLHRNGYMVIGTGEGRRGAGSGRGGGPVVPADVHIAHVDSAAAMRPLLDADYQEVTARISPDGQLVAYASNRAGRFEVYVRPLFQQGAETRISTDGGIEPLWSPDGRELFYRARGSMMSARLARSPRVTVVQQDSLFPDIYERSGIAASWDIFPDGREFVVLGNYRSVRQADAPLFVVVNWHARLNGPDRRRQ